MLVGTILKNKRDHTHIRIITGYINGIYHLSDKYLNPVKTLPITESILTAIYDEIS